MKKNILKTAFQLFLKNGFAGVSTNEIIREANVTKGCFYHYFKNKDDLAYDVIVMYLYPYLESPIMALEKQKNNTFENIHFCYTFMPQLILETGDIVPFIEIQSLIYEGIKKYNYLAKKSCECSRKQRFLLKKLLEQGKKEGIIAKKIDTDSYATNMMALKDGMVALHILDSSIDTKEKWESTFQTLWSEMKEVPQQKNINKGGYICNNNVIKWV